MVRIRKIKSIICNDEGSALGLFVVIILSMTLLATASVTLAQTQYSWARFSRQTSNSYQLARSGAEKTVDSMNKEIAKVLPDLMQKASEAAHSNLLDVGGVQYEEESGADAADKPYTGQYLGTAYENEYEIQLKKLMYEHIESKFALVKWIAQDPAMSPETDYEATKSDMKSPVKIKVQTNVYKNGTQDLPAYLIPAVNKLVRYLGDPVNPGEAGYTAYLAKLKEFYKDIQSKDAFLVEVTAWAEEGPKLSLTKSKIVGTISLDQLNKDEELIEEYEWADAYPEALQSAVISFGDFVVNGPYKAKIDGDISVKGTKGFANPANGEFPEPDKAGGIIVSDGGLLNVEGSALVVNNIQTTNSKSYAESNNTDNSKDTNIIIKKDAVASTIAINDNALESHEPWKSFINKNEIEIRRNVYMDNDLRVGRYVKNSKIKVANSVFGISDGDTDGVKKEGTDIKYVDPNKSSGIYALSSFSDEPKKITMAKAFIAGQAFINFGDGNGFHKLHESVGEPFEDVYYLDEYRMTYSSIMGEPEADSDAYITDFEDLIKTDMIEIRDKHAYAPSKISEEGTASTSPLSDPGEAKKLFYFGLDGSLPGGITAITDLTSSHDWEDKMFKEATAGEFTEHPIFKNEFNYNWKDVLLDPADFYTGKNPFKKNYFDNPDLPIGETAVTYGSLIGYKGLQGYMLGRRGVFYKHFVAGGTAGVTPVERKFEDLINVGAFITPQPWSRNNPIEVIVVSGDITIDIANYKNIPTAIVCTNPDAVLILTTTGTEDFEGIIITPGKIKIMNKMTINGVVIAGNEYTGPGQAAIGDIRTGEHAGIEIATSGEVTFKYDANKEEKDRNKLFDIRFMDKSLQRRLYDYLRMTDYASAPAPTTSEDSTEIENSNKKRTEAIFGADGKRKVKLSNESVISANQDGLQFTMKSLKKIKK